MQQQQWPRAETADAGGVGRLRGDGGHAADAIWFVGGGGEAWAATEGPADDDAVGGAVVLGEVVEAGDYVRRAVLRVGREAVVEADAGDGEEEGEFVG